SGQGETLHARRSGSPHAPWKAGGRSETKRSLPLLHTNKKQDRKTLYQTIRSNQNSPSYKKNHILYPKPNFFKHLVIQNLKLFVSLVEL
ncbi:hypothetical protein, partial [Rossellomorea marisflavi]|uniref:hypothetical protein n=1 Tax=Rossellomorea marisflavi TaxID=189381 RepID=UPI003D2F0B2E